MQIQGMEFSGFPGRDFDNLRRLDYAGRVEWLRFRFNLVFLTPFRRLLALEEPECYVWLCVMELSGAAIQALANLAIGNGSDHAKFTSFLNAYMPTFANANLQLDDPRGGRPNEIASTPADHFYKFFRSGLAHTFCIDWGGIQHREEIPNLGPEYLFSTTQGFRGEHGLGIIPREFVVDFDDACERVLTVFSTAEPGSQIRDGFERTFERVFLGKSRAPLP
jgi:hypothetical protein